MINGPGTLYTAPLGTTPEPNKRPWFRCRATVDKVLPSYRLRWHRGAHRSRWRMLGYTEKFEVTPEKRS